MDPLRLLQVIKLTLLHNNNNNLTYFSLLRNFEAEGNDPFHIEIHNGQNIRHKVINQLNAVYNKIIDHMFPYCS